MELKDQNYIQHLNDQIIRSKYVTPQAKGQAGMILFKIQNGIPLSEKEEQIIGELQTFLKVSC